MAEDWSQIEVDAIVSDYFDMLVMEIGGQPFVKAERRRNLQKLLRNRTEGSIEFKHQNISAILLKLGLPYINGYKPAMNYQKLLEDRVVAFLSGNLSIETSFQHFAVDPVVVMPALSFETIKVDEPERAPIAEEPPLQYRTKVPIIRNYLEIEQANQQIGSTGEQIAFEYERWRLISLGKEVLADKVEWISKSKGDGLGYDILSRNDNGTDRFIEVKSTKLTKEAPIYFSKGEFEFSRQNKENYFLYRVFNIKKDPKLFIVNGAFDQFCSTTEAVSFKGYF